MAGCELAEGAVRPGCVVVLKVFGQHPAQVVLVDDQQLAGELPAQGADDPFAGGVRSGRLRRAGGNPGAVGCGYGVGCAGELAGAVPDQELDWSRAMAAVHQEVTGRLRCPCATGMGGDADSGTCS